MFKSGIETMDKLLIESVANKAKIASSIKAPPARVNITNLIAEYSFLPEPHIPINIYIGINSNSKKTKNRSKSKDVKTPNTLVSNNNSHIKYSLTLFVIRNDEIIATIDKRPVNKTKGADKPSIPKI